MLRFAVNRWASRTNQHVRRSAPPATDGSPCVALIPTTAPSALALTSYTCASGTPVTPDDASFGVHSRAMPPRWPPSPAPQSHQLSAWTREPSGRLRHPRPVYLATCPTPTRSHTKMRNLSWLATVSPHKMRSAHPHPAPHAVLVLGHQQLCRPTSVPDKATMPASQPSLSCLWLGRLSWSPRPQLPMLDHSCPSLTHQPAEHRRLPRSASRRHAPLTPAPFPAPRMALPHFLPPALMRRCPCVVGPATEPHLAPSATGPTSAAPAHPRPPLSPPTPRSAARTAPASCAASPPPAPCPASWPSSAGTACSPAVGHMGRREERQQGRGRGRGVGGGTTTYHRVWGMGGGQARAVR